MHIFLVILSLFVVFALIVFLPVIFRQLKEMNAEHRLLKQITELDEFYRTKLQVVERPLGIGPSQNSDIMFCDAHKNQKFATASIMNLIDQLGD